MILCYLDFRLVADVSGNSRVSIFKMGQMSCHETSVTTNERYVILEESEDHICGVAEA
jgi:hypothetical protein